MKLVQMGLDLSSQPSYALIMDLKAKFLQWKVSKQVFFIALAVMIVQIGLAHHEIIKPISLSKDLTIFYAISLADFLVFPLMLSVVFLFIVDRVKWLDKGSFLLSFFGCIGFLIALLYTESTHFGGWIDNFFKFFIASGYPVFIFAPLGYFLAYILGWGAYLRSGFFSIVFIVSGFGFSIGFALFYSWISSLAKRSKKLPKKIFSWLLILYFIGMILFSANMAYVSTLADRGECIYGLNAYQCKDYEKLGGHYFRYKNDVYFSDLRYKLESEDASKFKVVKENEDFAVGKKVYYYGKVIPVSNIEKWAIIDNKKYYYQGLHSADDKNVFYAYRVLEYADPKSTAIFHMDYACNDKYVYESGKIIEGADPDTFVAYFKSCKEARENLKGKGY